MASRSGGSSSSSGGSSFSERMTSSSPWTEREKNPPYVAPDPVRVATRQSAVSGSSGSRVTASSLATWTGQAVPTRAVYQSPSPPVSLTSATSWEVSRAAALAPPGPARPPIVPTVPNQPTVPSRPPDPVGPVTPPVSRTMLRNLDTRLRVSSRPALEPGSIRSPADAVRDDVERPGCKKRPSDNRPKAKGKGRGRTFIPWC